MEPKKQTSGWQIRCLRCDSIEPWDKPVVRTKSSARKFIFGRCPQCKRIRFRVIEKVPDPKVKLP
jgi:Zn finger protein HypA/HybF involved in hydrogenase expression